MAQPRFVLRDAELAGTAVRIVSFEIPGGVTTPAEFADAVRAIESRLAGSFGVLIDGRGPVWGFAMLVHAAHASRFVATHDPRLGAVVVESHHPDRSVGEVVPFPAPAAG